MHSNSSSSAQGPVGRRSPIYSRSRAGQSVIVAIAVLFILAFMAALFVSILARNIQNTTRSSQTLSADFYAQSGVQYAEQMLTTSPEGADWRPPLQYQLASTSGLTPDELATYNAGPAAKLPVVPTDDPDSFWLDQGFTRYDTQSGRFLLRISYGGLSASNPTADPFDNTDAAEAKYIKIESIGRVGTVIANDPTTFTPQPIRLHAELVAYKPIGLVDYSRFITNKYDRQDTAELGVPSSYDANTLDSIVTPGVYDFYQAASGGAITVPAFPLVTVYGTPPAVGQTGGSGGSLRCNTNLRLYGYNVAFLNAGIGDDWEIAGNLTMDGFNDSGTGSAPLGTNPSALAVTGTDTTGTAQTGAVATPSNIASFPSGGAYTTIGGLIRDAGTGNDAQGFARSIQRLNPPSLDTIDPSSNLGRYAELTDVGGSATATDPGPYQVETATSPATVFIDNLSDIQQESTNVVSGAYTLRQDWLHHSSENWDGPFYNPPGATIVFGPIMVAATSGTTATETPFWGFTVTRSDSPVGLPAGSPVTWQWKDANGNTVVQPTPEPTITFAYGTAPAGYTFDPSNPVYFLGADNVAPAGQFAGGVNNNDIVIYAEGNVRVRGVVSPTSTTDPVTGQAYADGANAHHVTIVSGGIAYIEGSLLKGGVNYGYNATTPADSYQSTSSIAVLAETYVCVNTTQFLAGATLRSDFAPQSVGSGDESIDFNNNQLTEAFDLPSGNYGSNQALYLSQGSAGAGNSYGEITFNFANYTGGGAFTSQVVDGGSGNLPWLTGGGGYDNRSAQLLSNINTAFAPPAQGYMHLEMTFQRSGESASDWLLQRAAILPSDVRIEAILYAQDDSFFVIPGEWFNSDASDTVSHYVLGGAYARSKPDQNSSTPPYTDEHFPFYGQPIDMRITIDGSVIENMPADIADQSAWMDKWGWIPKFQGAELPAPSPNAATVQPSPHPSIAALLGATGGGTSNSLPGLPAAVQDNMPGMGLNIQYDPTAGTGASGGDYCRLDQYGRPLPYVPNLPVSPDLLYSGTTAGNSLVQ